MYGLITFYLSTLAILAPLLACAGIGLYWGVRKLPVSNDFITILVTSFSMPALIFQTLYSTQLDDSTLLNVGLSTFLVLAFAGAVFALVLYLMKLPVRSLWLVTAFPNSGNMGLPLTYLAFGETGLSAAVIFFAICSFLQNSIFVRVLPSANGLPIWRSPILLASLAALVMRWLEIPLPHWLLESAKMVGSMAVPLMLLSLGLALTRIPSGSLRTGSFLAALRLVLGLLCAWVVTLAMGLPDTISGIIMLQMSMPCAVTAYMFTARYTNHAGDAAGAVVVSTIAFLVLSPIVLLLVGASVPGLSD